MLQNVKKETLIRTIITAISMLNMILTMTGKNPLPFSEDELYIGLSAVAGFMSTVWSWWKNNSFSPEAIIADEYLEELRK